MPIYEYLCDDCGTNAFCIRRFLQQELGHFQN